VCKWRRKLPAGREDGAEETGIECDDVTKVQSILQSDKCAKGEGNFQLHAAKELRKQGIECDDPTKARSILNSINNPMKNPEFFANTFSINKVGCFES
jgi:hypothetical protein